MNKKLFSWVLLIFFLAGCAAPSAYRQVFEDKTTYNRRNFSVPKEALNIAVIKAFCEKKFAIFSEDRENGAITAERISQKGKRSFRVNIQSKIISDGPENSTLYLTAEETVERLYISDRTRFFLWIIPLPGGGGREASKVIERKKLIEDERFYTNFFQIIENNLKIRGQARKS